MTGKETDVLRVALLGEVFFGDGAGRRLHTRLHDARRAGAGLVVLPELPFQPWCPATRDVCDADAEPPDGPRQRLLREAAAAAGVAVLGGAIVRDPATGTRHNAALLVDAAGVLRATYRKVHLPHEPGFWEADHYAPGGDAPDAIEGLPLRLGIQICSDTNRPGGFQLLAARGAEAILVPRATEPTTYDAWRLVFRANALTSAAYVLSVNRPAPELGTALGGPSVCVAPDGSVVLETMEPLAIVEVRRAAVARARRDYPGYLAVPSARYAAWWNATPELPLHGGPR